MEKILLSFLDLFRWAYNLLKVDYEQVRSIVAIKLMMDNRRQLVGYQRKNKKEPANMFIRSMIFYAIFGSFVGWAVYAIPSFMVAMIMFYAYIMVMIAMTLITDFSSILLDTSDNTIILPRPVDGRTLFASRLTHILLYLGQLISALSIAPLIAASIKYGALLGVFFVIGIILAAATSVFITNAIYLLVLQFASEEKLKNIINYFQIGMAVFFMAGYQILPKILNKFNFEGYVFEIKWWAFLLPPVWFAGSLESIHQMSTDLSHLVLSVLALTIPATGLYVVGKYLSPIFARKLGAIGGDPDQVKSTDKKEQSNRIATISGVITSSPIERGAFEALFKILGRDRKIKLKVYPAYGYIFIFGFIFILTGKDEIATVWQALPQTKYHLLLIYLTFMVVQVALYEIPYSDDFKASWLYFSAPIQRPGEILSATVKAIMLRLFIPGYILISAVVLFVWKAAAIDDLIFGLFNNYMMLLVFASINKKYLPFSMAPNARNQMGNIVRSMLTFILIGLIGLSHYLLSLMPILVLAAIPVQILCIWLLQRSYGRTSWDDITL